MDLREYIHRNYSADEWDIEPNADPNYGAMTRFATANNIKYQTVQRWLKGGYKVYDGCIVRTVHTLY